MTFIAMACACTLDDVVIIAPYEGSEYEECRNDDKKRNSNYFPWYDPEGNGPNDSLASCPISHADIGSIASEKPLLIEGRLELPYAKRQDVAFIWINRQGVEVVAKHVANLYLTSRFDVDVALVLESQDEV